MVSHGNDSKIARIRGEDKSIKKKLYRMPQNNKYFWQTVFNSYYKRGMDKPRLAGYNRWTSLLARAIPFNVILNKIKSTGIALDLGCGWGYFTKIMENKEYNCIGVDFVYNHSLIFRKSCLSKFIVANAHNLPFHSNSFELISAVELFQYCKANIVLEECKRVLKNDGYLVIIAPNSFCIHWLFRRLIKKVHPNFIIYNPLQLIKYMKSIDYRIYFLKGIYSFPMEIKFLNSFSKLLLPVSIFAHSFLLVAKKVF